MNMKNILLLIGNVTFSTTANMLIKMGMKKNEGLSIAGIDGIINAFILNPAIIVGVLAYFISLSCYVILLKNVDLSVVFPITVSCAMISVTIVSGLVLKEDISTNHIIGGVIIMIGIFVLTR